MLITSRNLSTNPIIRASGFFTTNPLLSPIKIPKLTLSIPFNTPQQSKLLKISSPSLTTNSIALHRPIKSIQSDRRAVEVQNGEISFDGFLSFVEFFCLASSMVISVGYAMNFFVSTSQKPIIAWLGNRVFVLQSVLLVVAVTIGSIFRRRQWLRIYSGSSKYGSSDVNLERIEKLEEDVKSSVMIVRTLARQLEKLGIRFRLTRKGLKDPISETAALARKNSEATRSLALQGDILEKELSEIQMILLAMQEQQQKQLNLILAISKTQHQM
ncbi:uncharacterized protein LOC124926857 [Impatiens glandulifera]|uniref:uncharacterized protein LOC124926857 n=1 Tax=Impatiens glandulifera TaxID=253017 RepID=UPI001FB0AC27|nr:uncharacterized protein LOC124926857 [Impatiens glandulifera]